MMQPKLAHSFIDDGCFFRMKKQSDQSYENPLITQLGTTPETVHGQEVVNGYVAVRIDGQWKIEDAIYTISTGSVSCANTLEHLLYPDAIAYPVDTRLSREDIDGATIIKPNATNDGWLFFHAEVEEQHDRELLIKAAIVGSLQYEVDEAILGYFKASNNNSVAQAKKAVYADILDFRNDWQAKAQGIERGEHIGHHVHNETYIHEVVINSFNATVKKWKADKSAEWDRIDFYIERAAPTITGLHQYKEPWNTPARVAARKKAAAEAEAAAETESASSEGSDGE